jgi:sulfite exporter TauE/SafE
MGTSLVLAGFLMGLAGGPHCAAMCGAACAGIVRGANARAAPGMAKFQLGRLVGYSAAGAAAAGAVQSFAWLSGSTAALRPVWTIFHLLVLGWGLVLVVLARQPAWVDGAGRAVWSRIRPIATARGGLVATGALWIFMPCGLLYSALLVASLSGGPLEGALSMALFALGSGLSLGLFPGVLALIRRAGERVRKDWGTRAAGALLAGAAGWALWMDVSRQVAQWCE